jgi:NH3-dependent NAD+ synthetase
LHKKHPFLKQLISAALPEHGVVYENIQARLRQAIFMMFVNIENKKAIANSNLDELYAGYTTYGGDLHSGMINLNSGLHKIDQKELLLYLKKKGIKGVLKPVELLKYTNSAIPSAELQPKKNDNIVQFDEESLQGTFEQKAYISRLFHYEKIDSADGRRKLKAKEIFLKAKKEPIFKGLTEDQLFNVIVTFYQNWLGKTQLKIYSMPISPTFGENLDKQISLRSSNISGNKWDELIQLGIDIMYEWSKKDGLNWDNKDIETLYNLSWQNKKFVENFIFLLKTKSQNSKNQISP